MLPFGPTTRDATGSPPARWKCNGKGATTDVAVEPAHRIPDKEEAMHKIGLTLTATLAIVGAMIGGRSHAAVIAPIGLGAAADELAAVESVQFTWRGRPFCWYNSGWRG